MGKTPLLRAIENGHIEIVQMLLANDRVTVLSTHKEQENEEDDNDPYNYDAVIPQTIVDDAVRCEQFEIFKFLVGHKKVHEMYKQNCFQVFHHTNNIHYLSLLLTVRRETIFCILLQKTIPLSILNIS